MKVFFSIIFLSLSFSVFSQTKNNFNLSNDNISSDKLRSEIYIVPHILTNSENNIELIGSNKLIIQNLSSERILMPIIQPPAISNNNQEDTSNIQMLKRYDLTSSIYLDSKKSSSTISISEKEN